MTTERPIPGSRWRSSDDRPAEARGAGNRVREAQAQARVSLALGAAFALAAVVAAVAPADTGRWLPVHLFFGGTVVLAISGASMLFTVTWSAAPAPPPGVLAVQRGLVAAGIAAIAVGREADLGDAMVVAGASAFLAGLALLAVALVGTVRRGPERRFDAAVGWYVAALVAGLVAGPMGAAMAIGRGGDLRAAHLCLNLFGLVGLVIAGTLPSFAATAARSRMAPHATPRRHALILAWQVAALAVSAGALGAGHDALAAAGLLAYAVGIVAIALLLPRAGRSKLEWAGPRLLGLWCGIAWWVVCVIAAAVTVARDRAVLADRWLVVLTVAGFAQILWASYAYLVPMLRGGGHERLSEGFATTRSWVGLGAVNTAGIAAVVDVPPLTGAAVTVWLVDAAWRAVRLRGRAAVSPG